MYSNFALSIIGISRFLGETVYQTYASQLCLKDGLMIKIKTLFRSNEYFNWKKARQRLFEWI